MAYCIHAIPVLEQTFTFWRPNKVYKGPHASIDAEAGILSPLSKKRTNLHICYCKKDEVWSNGASAIAFISANLIDLLSGTASRTTVFY
jgi:hypothetical protein